MNKNSKQIEITSRWTNNFVYVVEVAEAPVQQMLSATFRLTNRDDRPMSNEVCSTSIGDILKVDDRYFIVDTFGFVEISAADAEAWKQIDQRDAHMGVKYCIEHGQFTGKALNQIQ